MSSKIKTFAILTAAGILFSPAVYASGAMPSDDSGKAKAWGGKMRGDHQEFYKDLNLTDAQKKSLEENKAKNRERSKALLESIHQKRELMRQELQKDDLNMAAINQIQNDLKAAQAQMVDNRLQSILEVRKILTPEQFKKFVGHTEDRAEHHHKHE